MMYRYRNTTTTTTTNESTIFTDTEYESTLCNTQECPSGRERERRTFFLDDIPRDLKVFPGVKR